MAKLPIPSWPILASTNCIKLLSPQLAVNVATLIQPKVFNYLGEFIAHAILIRLLLTEVSIDVPMLMNFEGCLGFAQNLNSDFF